MSYKTTWDVPEERDEVSRMATAYLYKRAVDTAGGFIVNGTVAGALCHWTLVLEFEGEDWRTAEGVQDEHGVIVPKYTKQRPIGFRNQNKLGQTRMSPLMLRRYVWNHSCNGKEYCTMTNNCQLWIISLCKEFSTEIANKIDPHVTVTETGVFAVAYPLLGFAAHIVVKLAFAAFGIPPLV